MLQNFDADYFGIAEIFDLGISQVPGRAWGV